MVLVMSIFDGARTVIDGRNLSFAISDSNRVGDTTVLALSFATNLFASASIGFTTWWVPPALCTLFLTSSQRHQIRTTLTTSTPGIQRISRLLFLLTETAVMYCFFQLLAIISVATPSRQSSVGDIVSSSYLAGLNILSALYPTILIIIIGRESRSRSRMGRVSSRGQRGTPDVERNIVLTTIPQGLNFPSTIGSSDMNMEDTSQKAGGDSVTNLAR